MIEEKESTTWKYMGNVKPLSKVVHSPRMDAPREVKDSFINVLDNHIGFVEDEIKKENK